MQRSEADRGDGAITRAQALVGGDIGQGSWMLGADYVDQKGVSMAAREYSAIPLVGRQRGRRSRGHRLVRYPRRYLRSARWKRAGVDAWVVHARARRHRSDSE